MVHMEKGRLEVQFDDVAGLILLASHLVFILQEVCFSLGLSGVSCPTYLCIQVEVKSGADGFIIKMRDGRNLRCVHNSPHGGLLPNYAPHPAIVLKMEDGTGLLLPIIVLEMPSVMLMAAVRNVQIAKSTLYQVVKEMIDKMVMKSELAV